MELRALPSDVVLLGGTGVQGHDGEGPDSPSKRRDSRNARGSGPADHARQPNWCVRLAWGRVLQGAVGTLDKPPGSGGVEAGYLCPTEGARDQSQGQGTSLSLPEAR